MEEKIVSIVMKSNGQIMIKSETYIKPIEMIALFELAKHTLINGQGELIEEELEE